MNNITAVRIVCYLCDKDITEAKQQILISENKVLIICEECMDNSQGDEE